MKNKVEIRAFAVEQVVKMRCMSDCTIEEVVEQSKLVEGYIIGDAELTESGNEMSEMTNFFKNALNKLEKAGMNNPHTGWCARSSDEHIMGADSLVGCGVKECEA